MNPFVSTASSVVAFAPFYAPADSSGDPPLLPPIIGTGFFVDNDGLACTADHVLQSFSKLLVNGLSTLRRSHESREEKRLGGFWRT